MKLFLITMAAVLLVVVFALQWCTETRKFWVCRNKTNGMLFTRPIEQQVDWKKYELVRVGYEIVWKVGTMNGEVLFSNLPR